MGRRTCPLLLGDCDSEVFAILPWRSGCSCEAGQGAPSQSAGAQLQAGEGSGGGGGFEATESTGGPAKILLPAVGAGACSSLSPIISSPRSSACSPRTIIHRATPQFNKSSPHTLPILPKILPNPVPCQATTHPSVSRAQAALLPINNEASFVSLSTNLHSRQETCPAFE